MSKSAASVVASIGGPGIKPVEYRVLIDLDEVEQKTKGGIYLPDASKERQQMATVRGTVIACGAMAFEDWQEDDRLVPGARVLLKKYAGEVAEGLDGREYRLVNDKEILGVLRD